MIYDANVDNCTVAITSSGDLLQAFGDFATTSANGETKIRYNDYWNLASNYVNPNDLCVGSALKSYYSEIGCDCWQQVLGVENEPKIKKAVSKKYYLIKI